MKSLMNKKGFTLIELMIVIAIIGVLAAIAIPNFISYRDKSYCSSAENNARTVASAVAEYYSVASRIAPKPQLEDLKLSDTRLVSYATIKLGTNATGPKAIVIEITDPTGRCPQDYREANERWSDGTQTVYTFKMQ